MDFIEGIFGIALLIATIYGVTLVFAFLSKISGKKIVRHGHVMYEPDDFDNLIKVPKKLLNSTKNKVEKLQNNLTFMKKINNGEKVTDKVTALRELNELYEKGVIDKNEFNSLKYKILN
jgi:hypothetical protein